MGPADAVESPSMFELEELKAKGQLSAIQADIFAVPRAKEELYDYRKDPLQLVNVVSVPEYKETLIRLRKIMKQWMEETGDSIPVYLTKDWYYHKPGYIKTRAEGTRGEMPGKSNSATKINHRGPF